MDFSLKLNEEYYLDEGSVSPMQMRQTNLEFTDSTTENEHRNEGSNPEDSTEGTLKRKKDEEKSSSLDLAVKFPRFDCWL